MGVFSAPPPPPASPPPTVPSLLTGFNTACALLIAPIFFKLSTALLRGLGLLRPAIVPCDGRCVLITGCDSGFGQHLARAAREAGFDVVAACYTEAGARHFDGAERTSAVVADLTKAEGLARVVAAAKLAAGSRGLHAIVNNAGLCLPGNIEWARPSTYEATMALNFHAPVALTYELLPALKAARGRVINVTSVDGFMALPTNAAYNASKHALEAYSDTLRCEMLPWGVQW